jgi:hypothetical protein
MKKILLVLMLATTLSSASFAQATNWGGDALATAKVIGQTNNHAMGLETNGTNRIVISDNSTTVPGGVVIGDSPGLTFNPKFRLELNETGATAVGMRVTNFNTGVATSSGMVVAINNLGTIGRIGWLAGTQSMRITTAGIDKITVLSSGFTGICPSNSFTPGQRLDVDSGDVDVNQPVNGYMIGNNYVLRHNTITTNIYVGVGAGNTSSTAIHNTFVGNNAGTSITTGNNCTFVGHNAGYSTTNAVRCTFVGDSAGFANTTGRWNTFTGYACGVSTSTGENNSFYGKHCGPSNTTGTSNCYFGNHAGQSMIDGNSNVMIGNDAGNYQEHGDSSVIVGNGAGWGASAFLALKGNTFLGASAGRANYTASLNTFLGFKSGNNSSYNPNNSTTVGANAIVRTDNRMILGDNLVWVGIGVSDDASATLGPGNSLEINARDNTGRELTDASGLRFRQLTSASNATDPNGKVLTVDANGDVILVTCCTAEGLKELSEKLEKQQKEIDRLNSLIAEQSAGSQGSGNASNTSQYQVELSDNNKDVIVLEQNVPNPFAEQTVIGYNLPESISKAQLLFYNQEGKLINSLEISQKGKGQVTVIASDLSNGTYTYTLVADGKVVDTKRMIKSK